MVTKEQCLLNRVLAELEYGRNDRLAQYVLAAYNQGKRYASDMIFQNDENGFYQALKGLGEAEICKVFYETVGDFDQSAPFFTVDYKLNSVDTDEFIRMLTPEDKQKLLNQDILDELDSSDITDAFDTFLHTNYPQVYDSIDLDWLYDMDYRTEYQILNADWNQLVKELQEYRPGEDLNETRSIRLSESDLRKMTNEAVKKILNKKK
jgi:hypothetical protein